MSTGLVWLRRDLRLADQPALAQAAKSHDRLLLVYIHDPEAMAPWQPGAASRWWLHHSLNAFMGALDELGQRLVLLRGSDYDAGQPSCQALMQLAEQHQVEQVYWNRAYEPALRERDDAVALALEGQGVEVAVHAGNLLAEPWQVLKDDGDPYRVFTPYWKRLQTELPGPAPLPAPQSLPAPPDDAPGGVELDQLSLLPEIDWDTGLARQWTPGEEGAWARFGEFADGPMADYADARDRPDMDGTSMLSPHLHHGEISPRSLLHALAGLEASSGKGSGAWVRELGWREFSVYLLHHFPDLHDSPMNPDFSRYPWQQGPSEALSAWQQGRTGIPLVDAGMRQLWQTGWMHNRVRMVVASFLTKNLGIHWLEGARWFWDTLVDADLANNTQGWQWTAGCGADAAPFFRIFNPVLQSEKFDPHGRYLKQWVAELGELDGKYIHQPGSQRPADYPEPLVDLKASRKKALAVYQEMRQANN